MNFEDYFNKEFSHLKRGNYITPESFKKGMELSWKRCKEEVIKVLEEEANSPSDENWVYSIMIDKIKKL